MQDPIAKRSHRKKISSWRMYFREITQATRIGTGNTNCHGQHGMLQTTRATTGNTERPSNTDYNRQHGLSWTTQTVTKKTDCHEQQRRPRATRTITGNSLTTRTVTRSFVSCLFNNFTSPDVTPHRREIGTVVSTSLEHGPTCRDADTDAYCKRIQTTRLQLKAKRNTAGTFQGHHLILLVKPPRAAPC